MKDGSLGFGSIYRMTPGGTVTVLHSFSVVPDGAGPTGSLVQSADGSLYGVAAGVGTVGDAVNVFKVTLDGTFTLLDAFQRTSPTYPIVMSGLIQASDGNFYGTIGDSGSQSGNVLFRLASSAPAVILSPRPGSMLSNDVVTFSWAPAVGGSGYQLEAATDASWHTVFFSQLISSATSQTITVPLTGDKIYVRLRSLISSGWTYYEYVYSVADGRATMASPAPGTVLTGPTATFSWTSGTDATAYWLDVGTSVGQTNLFSQGTGSAASQVVSNLPVAGGPIYVRLWTQFTSGGWYYRDYTYTAADAKAAMISPAPGSTLAGSTVTFSWNAAAGASQYWLEVGTASGQGNLFEQTAGLATSQVVSGILGGTIYVRLWTQRNGGWVFNDYTYTASNASNTRGHLTSPLAGSTLSGANVTFTWSAGGSAVAYWLEVGTSVGSHDIFGQSVGVATSQNVNGLPLLGGPVYVRLWTELSGSWVFDDYTYTASNAKAAMTSPTPGSTLGGATVTFTWSAGPGATTYWLDVGTNAGSADLFSRSVGLATSQSVSGLPVLGGPVYVRLWSQVNGSWLFNDYFYTAVTITSPAVMTSPSAFTWLTPPSVTFQWSPGAGATQYWLDVGTTLGGHDIFSQGVGLATSRIVSGFPELPNYRSVFARLWTQIGGSWLYIDYNYVLTNTGATIAAPAVGVLPAQQVTFSWAGVSGATSYWLEVGTTLGGSDVFGQNVGLATGHVVDTGMLGKRVYVRLWTQRASGWIYNDVNYVGFDARASMTSPVPWSMLSGSSVTFNWSVQSGAASQIAGYWLDIGTAPGGSDLVSRFESTATSDVVNNLPASGDTIYVRLWTQFTSGSWNFRDYMYTVNAKATMWLPVPGFVLGGSSVTFQWNAGVNTSEYWLEVGTTVGQHDIFGGSTGVLTTAVVNGVPTAAGVVYVRLWTRFGTSWRYIDYSYRTAASVPVTTTLDFTGVGNDGSPLSAFTKAGFTVTPTSGAWTIAAPFAVFSTPGNAEIVITTAGAPFSFQSVYVYSSTTPIPYVFTGSRNGSTVFTVSGVVSNPFGASSPVINGRGADPIDTLSIAPSNPDDCCGNPVGIYSIVLVR
jgi:hypothetical protein